MQRRRIRLRKLNRDNKMSERDKIIWELDYKISPLPMWDEEVEGIIFKKDNEEVKAHTESFLDSYRKRDDTYLALPPEHEMKQHIRNLIILRSIHNSNYEPISIHFQKARILNKEYLKSKGYKINLLFEQAENYNLIVLDENNYFSEAVEYWSNGFQKKTQGAEDDIIEIVELIIKSKEERDEVRSFILLYIAFNCLYSHFARKVSYLSKSDTKTEIKNVIYKLFKDEDIERITKAYNSEIIQISKLDITSTTGKKENLSLTLQHKIENNCDKRHILYFTCICIHEVRNEIFHYSIGVNNIFWKATISKNILLRILERAIKNYVTYQG